MPLIVVLDDVRSMYNIGSVFRTCDAFRVEAIYLCGITACPPHQEIHKTALGAEDSVRWRYFKTAQEAVEQLHEDGYFVWSVEQCEGSVKAPTPSNSPEGRLGWGCRYPRQRSEGCASGSNRHERCMPGDTAVRHEALHERQRYRRYRYLGVCPPVSVLKRKDPPLTPPYMEGSK